jgi:hypothetical protein
MTVPAPSINRLGMGTLVVSLPATPSAAGRALGAERIAAVRAPVKPRRDDGAEAFFRAGPCL